MNQSAESTVVSSHSMPKTAGHPDWYRRPGRVTLIAACLTAVGALAIGSAWGASGSMTSAASASVVSMRSSGYGNPYGSAATTTQSAATTASGSESTGIVLIETVLGYEDAAAAGTGMVLSSGGLVLTNNHVVAGSTQVSVTIATTGETYVAKVVGTDASHDVALLQLQDASGLDTITIDQDDAERAGDAVSAIGNANGGGVLLAADGTITKLDSTVTTSAEGAAEGETLNGVIQIAAQVVPGDSGGALLDADGEVIGMTTAASSGTADITGWAIPIESALTLAQQMANGDESGSVTIGYPAFLGIGIGQSTAGSSSRYGGGYRQQTVAGAGVSVGGVFDGTPAARAGLAAGDTITAVDGATLRDETSLSTILASHEPGDSVTLTWVDPTGDTHSASVTLIAGPVA